MPSFDQTFSLSEPTIVLPPSHPFDRRPFNTSRNLSTLPKASPRLKNPPTASWAQKSQSQITNSRKRSRDEAAPDLSEDEHYFAGSSSPILAPETEDEWQYGEGMTLIKPNGFIIDAGSQTGTWAEEKATQEKTEQERALQQTIENARPILRNAKSQRLDHSATALTSEDLTSYSSAASSPPKQKSEPTVDDFTIHLGIGWSRISDDAHIQAAARGWAKFIENNYPVTCPSIQLESRGLNSYLVEAKEGFFLFAEDLKQGRLVSTDLVKAVQNLQVRPPIFDGNDVLIASSETVTPASTNEVLPQQQSTNHIVPTTSMDVEMDMN